MLEVRYWEFQINAMQQLLVVLRYVFSYWPFTYWVSVGYSGAKANAVIQTPFSR